MEQEWLEHTSRDGMLYAIDATAQHLVGAEYEDPGSGAMFMYCYNAGATLSQGRLMHLVWGQYGRTAIAVADGQAYYTLKGVAQAVLTNGTYGWFQFEGPTLNRLFHDGIDDNSEALTTVVGQGLSLSSGLCVTAALAWTDEKDFAVSTEVRATSVSSHAILFGKVTLDTV